MDTLGSNIAWLIILSWGVFLVVCFIGDVSRRSDRPRARGGERRPRYRRGPRGEPEPDPSPKRPLPDSPPAAAALAIEEHEGEAEATVSAIASRSADGRPLEREREAA